MIMQTRACTGARPPNNLTNTNASTMMAGSVTTASDATMTRYGWWCHHLFGNGEHTARRVERIVETQNTETPKTTPSNNRSGYFNAV